MENYGTKNMVSMLDHETHSVRKRMLSHVYSKSFLLSETSLSASTTCILRNRLLPHLRLCGTSQVEVEVTAIFSAVAIDINTAYIYGLKSGTNFTRNLDHCRRFLTHYHAREPWMLWKQEFPILSGYISTLKRLLGLPRNVARRRLEAEFLQWNERAAKRFSELPSTKVLGNNRSRSAYEEGESDHPLIYAQLRSSIERLNDKSPTQSPEVEQRMSIAAELLDLLSAGFETSTMTMKDIVRRLSWNPNIQFALHSELRSLQPPLRFDTPMQPLDAKAIDNLPLLAAVIYETLRLHPPAQNGLPRVVPPAGCTIAGYHIPRGVRVSAQAYSLHRNPVIFPDPEAWKPERWLDNAGKLVIGGEMHRWWWAFGSGGRKCIGSQFALYQLKYILTAIYSNFETKIQGKERRELGQSASLSEASQSVLMVQFVARSW